MYDSPNRGPFEHPGDADYLHLLREVLLTHREFQKRISDETGLSGAQFEVMRELALAEGRSTISALSRRLSVDPAAASRTVASLQKLGLVSRQRDDSDGRRQPVFFTQEGSELMTTLHAEAHEYESILSAALDPQSLETAMQVLHAFRDALGSVSRGRTRSGYLERIMS